MSGPTELPASLIALGGIQMNSAQECLKLIQQVRAASLDPPSAYLVRSRLKRSLLACSKLAAAHAGLPERSMPGLIPKPSGCSPEVGHVIELCNLINGSAEHLCQPSEALDQRWARGWDRLLDDLSQLSEAVKELEARV